MWFLREAGHAVAFHREIVHASGNPVLQEVRTHLTVRHVPVTVPRRDRMYHDFC
ncbi:hypothetical protein [Streptosporangium saharense]|uniref:hypothetical protein n=1 Tax=Streptosporangium saharense TaxID=1706840 RepID=UPI0034370AB2